MHILLQFQTLEIDPNCHNEITDFIMHLKKKRKKNVENTHMSIENMISSLNFNRNTEIILCTRGHVAKY